MSLTNIDLESLSIAELEELIQLATAQIQRTKAKKIADTRREIERLTREAGVSLGELFELGDKMPSKKTRAVVAPKYRNPDNPAQTWTGRGQKPVWLRFALQQGAKIEDFLITA